MELAESGIIGATKPRIPLCFHASYLLEPEGIWACLSFAASKLRHKP
jgi:hypothetical protein